MTAPDYTPDVIALPSPLVTLLSNGLQHLLTLGAGVLVTDGIIQQSAVTQDATVGAGLLLGLIGYGWAQWQRAHNHKTAVAAVAQAKAS